MSDFNAKVHQIRFSVELCPRPRLGELSKLLQIHPGVCGSAVRSAYSAPRDPWVYLKEPTSKEAKGRGRKGGEMGNR